MIEYFRTKGPLAFQSYMLAYSRLSPGIYPQVCRLSHSHNALPTTVEACCPSQIGLDLREKPTMTLECKEDLLGISFELFLIILGTLTQEIPPTALIASETRRTGLGLLADSGIQMS